MLDDMSVDNVDNGERSFVAEQPNNRDLRTTRCVRVTVTRDRELGREVRVLISNLFGISSRPIHSEFKYRPGPMRTGCAGFSFRLYLTSRIRNADG